MSRLRSVEVGFLPTDYLLGHPQICRTQASPPLCRTLRGTDWNLAPLVPTHCISGISPRQIPQVTSRGHITLLGPTDLTSLSISQHWSYPTCFLLTVFSATQLFFLRALDMLFPLPGMLFPSCSHGNLPIPHVSAHLTFALEWPSLAALSTEHTSPAQLASISSPVLGPRGTHPAVRIFF